MERAEASDTYEIRVDTSFREWWRYNVFISAACYDDNDAQTSYVSVRDTIYEPDDGTRRRTMPQDYPAGRTTRLAAPECRRMEIYIYVITNTIPSDSIIKHSPPFDITVRVTKGTENILTQTVEVNQWGGAVARFDIKE